ncbi:acyl-CoA dehydrogenase family protein [Brevibacterium album]|uniref:acyl-CoA dehydrogenase family protein n=1 Tax=Brevibacterium album TaxID=417948 RepID=UPI0003F9C812|nr:acyl-CoA dehydrogenase family protein [Brevibacterium album]
MTSTMSRSETAVPDSFGIDRIADDESLASLLPLYLEPVLLAHLRPVLADLGPRLGGELDALAGEADRNPPVLEHRTRTGLDRQSVRVHPAYRRLQEVAFGELGMAAASHRPGALGWHEPLPPVAKYLLFYLFAQAEFGLECPVSMTDALARTLRRFGSQELLDRYLPGLTSMDVDELTQGAMFMTEQDAGSDVGRTATTARDNGDGTWALTGQKWFCSNVDAELAMVLARPEGAAAGIRGIGLFLLPRHLPDGSPNRMRIVRLKDKLGTRSMPSGEIDLDGATAHLVGDIGQGFKQMADMINASRLSNGVRSAGLMRRAFGEARHVCRNREAFGTALIDLPLQRRQLAKLRVTAEQALSVVMHTAEVFGRADGGDAEAAAVLRILTPLVKFRVCRDARKVTADAMEVRGGVGYIEEFGDARVFRDAQLGSIWEGTSNIVALDVVRAAHRAGALKPLIGHLQGLLAEAGEAGLPPRLRSHLDRLVLDALHALEMHGDGGAEWRVRQVASATYHVLSAVVLAWEGARIAESNGDWTRVAYATLVLEHRVLPQDPFAPSEDDPELLRRLIEGEPVDRETVWEHARAVLPESALSEAGNGSPRAGERMSAETGADA